MARASIKSPSERDNHLARYAHKYAIESRPLVAYFLFIQTLKLFLVSNTRLPVGKRILFFSRLRPLKRNLSELNAFQLAQVMTSGSVWGLISFFKRVASCTHPARPAPLKERR